ncbi:MAG TPA: WhiB family transcriptional regulator [Jiangellaceae bacterium]|nr:WhiB family transcriptional regulator [Jiangellaceae bacterium]
MSGWWDDALCRQIGDPELWYPAKEAGRPHAAIRICADCPVRVECLQHALDNDEAGVWGGTTERERRRMRARRVA